jgi:hypothetical protein
MLSRERSAGRAGIRHNVSSRSPRFRTVIAGQLRLGGTARHVVCGLPANWRGHARRMSCSLAKLRRACTFCGVELPESEATRVMT